MSRLFSIVVDTSGVHLWLVLMKAHRALGHQAEKSISSTGICFTDFALLEILLNKGPLPVNTLAKRLGLTSGSGTSAIDRLEERGLVERHADPEDKRARVVHLTTEGKALISGAFRAHAHAMEETAQGLTIRERATLLALLRKLGKWELKNAAKNTENE